MIATLKDGTPKVACPLCLKWMRYEYVQAREIFVFCCDTDKVAISEDDPHLGRWDEVREKLGEAGKIQCVLCNADMRFFSTSKNFLKAKCPKKKCGSDVVMGDAPDESKVYIAPRSPLHKA